MEQERPGKRIGIGFAQFEAVLLDALMVAPSKRPAFLSRIKQWRKMGFPQIVPVGRGGRATYTMQHLLEVLVLVNLLDAGVPPDRAITLLSNHDVARALIADAFVCLERLAHGDDRALYASFRLAALDAYLDDSDRGTFDQFTTYERSEIIDAMTRPFWTIYSKLDLQNDPRDARGRVSGFEALNAYSALRGSIIVDYTSLVAKLLHSVHTIVVSEPRDLIWIAEEMLFWKEVSRLRDAQRSRQVLETAASFAQERDRLVAADAAGDLPRGMGPAGQKARRNIAEAIVELSEHVDPEA